MKKSLLTAQPYLVAGPHPHHNTPKAAHSKAMKYGATRFELSRTSFLKIAANGAGRILISTGPLLIVNQIEIIVFEHCACGLEFFARPTVARDDAQTHQPAHHLRREHSAPGL